MKKPVKEYITEYLNCKGRKQGGSIYAENIEQAEETLKRRKETEKILGCDPTKEYLLD
jgi:type II secretory pathway component PulF